MAETVSKFRAFVTDKGGKILHEDAWGLRKLAYPIQKKSTGFYHLMEFEADTNIILPFETEFVDERIIRFLTTKMDKHHCVRRSMPTSRTAKGKRSCRSRGRG